MKKSLLALLLIFSFIFIMSGCSSETENTVSSSSQKSSSINSGSSKTASSAGTPTVKLGDVAASVGDTVNIPVTVTAGAGIAATDMYIYFDTTKFKYVSQKIGTGYSGALLEGNEVESGKVKITLATLNVPDEACEMYTVSFEVLEGAEEVNDFKLEVYTCYASDAKTDIVTNAVNGTVTVK